MIRGRNIVKDRIGEGWYVLGAILVGIIMGWFLKKP
jgi:hypothetical protein